MLWEVMLCGRGYCYGRALDSARHLSKQRQKNKKNRSKREEKKRKQTEIKRKPVKNVIKSSWL